MLLQGMRKKTPVHENESTTRKRHRRTSLPLTMLVVRVEDTSCQRDQCHHDEINVPHQHAHGPRTRRWINSKLIGPHGGLLTSSHYRRYQCFLVYLPVYRHAYYSHLRSFFYGMCFKLGTLPLTLFPLDACQAARISPFVSLLIFTVLKAASFCQQCATIKGTPDNLGLVRDDVSPSDEQP